MSAALSLTSRVVAAPRQLSSELSGEVVILGLSDGAYYGLDAVGAQIWRLLGQPCTVHDLVTDVARRYPIDCDTCADDVIRFLEDLHAHGLDGRYLRQDERDRQQRLVARGIAPGCQHGRDDSARRRQ